MLHFDLSELSVDALEALEVSLMELQANNAFSVLLSGVEESAREVVMAFPTMEAESDIRRAQGRLLMAQDVMNARAHLMAVIKATLQEKYAEINEPPELDEAGL